MTTEVTTKRLSITVSDQTLNLIEALEKRYGWTKSQVISVAIAHYQPPRLPEGDKKHDHNI